MSKRTFDIFLKQQEIQESEEAEVDWQEVKNEWLESVEEFYDQIIEILKEYIEKSKIKVEYETIDIHEDYLGSYSIRSLVLTVGTQKVSFIPIGRLIFGARGRIDMEGRAGTVKFVLTDSRSKKEIKKVEAGHNSQQSKYTWKIWVSVPRNDFIDIKDDMFLDALMAVING